MLDTNHQLYQLSEAIDWFSLEKEITRLMDERYESQWRVVSGSVYLKSFYDITSADVIERWSKCPYLRFFCSGEILVAESPKPFPVSLQVLDQLSFNLIGKGYDVMIKALQDSRLIDIAKLKTSPTIH